MATWAFALTCKQPLEGAGLGLKDTEEGLDADDSDDEDDEEDGNGKKAAVAAVATMADPIGELSTANKQQNSKYSYFCLSHQISNR